VPRNLYAPLRVPLKARTLARNALSVRTRVPKYRQAGTDAGIATATALAGSSDNPGTWYAIRRFWPRWATRYRFLVARGETAETSKVVMAGDLWGGLPMLEVVEAEDREVMLAHRAPVSPVRSTAEAADAVAVAVGRKRGRRK
jgi:hypothetical protein